MSSAIGYTRLSQESDTSIDRQKRHIREYAAKNNLTLETIYDDGERSSGFDESREEYQQVLDRVQAGKLTAVIVNDKRRLARDFDETMRLVLDLREHDVEAHTYQEGSWISPTQCRPPSRSSRPPASTKRKRKRSSGPARPSKNASTTATTTDGRPSASGSTTPASSGYRIEKAASRTLSKPSGWSKTVLPTVTSRRSWASHPRRCLA